MKNPVMMKSTNHNSNTTCMYIQYGTVGPRRTYQITKRLTQMREKMWYIPGGI